MVGENAAKGCPFLRLPLNPKHGIATQNVCTPPTTPPSAVFLSFSLQMSAILDACPNALALFVSATVGDVAKATIRTLMQVVATRLGARNYQSASV